MNVVILDDEAPAIKILSSYVSKIRSLNLIQATTNPFEVIETLNTQTVDLLFLDIEMPDINGIEFLKSIDQKPMVVFTTAFEKYALQGYDLDIIDYLVKPIRLDRFIKSTNKALRLYNLQNKTAEEKPTFIHFKVEYKTVKVLLDDILYIEGLKDYVKVFTTQDMILTRLNIKGIYEKLPHDQFIRVHRSFIVSTKHITAFNKGSVLIKEITLPLGETYRENVLNILT